MISMQGGHFVPIPFTSLIDNETGRARIRLVDIRSTRYAIARRPMIRLGRDDFEDPHELAKFVCWHSARGVPPAVRVSRQRRAAAAHG
jgi:6-phosphofructokinase 1